MKTLALGFGTMAAIVTLFTASARCAFAQEDRMERLGTSPRSEVHSAQHFAGELRFSPYSADVDSDPALAGATPYGDSFGSSPRLFIGGELDWQALRIPHFGSLGPGASAGLVSMGAQAKFKQEHNGTLISGETTGLQIYPFAALAVLRVDALWRDVGIPLVPYAKIGIGYALWRASNTLGTSSAGGVSGKGSSLGTHVALGLSLNLNGFDGYAAQNLDDAMGINNTYIFAEWMREDLTGLGVQSDPLRVGGTNWTFGLAFEF